MNLVLWGLVGLALAALTPLVGVAALVSGFLALGVGVLLCWGLPTTPIHLLRLSLLVLAGMVGVVVASRRPGRSQLELLCYAVACYLAGLFFVSRSLLVMVLLWVTVEALLVPGFLLAGPRGLRGLALMALLCIAPCDAALFALLGLSYQAHGVGGLLAGVEALPVLDEVAGLLLVVALAAKLGCPPFTAWVVEAYSTARGDAVAVLSGLSSKMAVLLIALLVLGSRVGVSSLLALAVAGMVLMVYGGLRAVCENEYRRLLGYSSLSAYGLLLACLAGLGWSSLMVYPLILASYYHGLAKAGLFIEAERLEKLYGTTRLDGLRAPLSGWRMMWLLASLAGAPPALGFLAKLCAAYGFILLASTSPLWCLVLACFMVSAVLSASYTLRLLSAYTPALSEPRPWPGTCLASLLVTASTLPLALVSPWLIPAVAALVVYLATLVYYPLSQSMRVRSEGLWVGGGRV